ncbi:DNA-binding IclR family transcriptional regulator [Arthrobacter globiformis]|uniref:IclR family transcriptional regulator n=1 Tax=Arthrobacter globiformis TaxID=1665 RepID=UPI00277F64D3|nr:IclR family transcriptional regulator [Arthrobacter globiformis]MDQ1058066.1 DNA-binding IclR family transcriptional regulator [Arthrobacter globiformis]
MREYGPTVLQSADRVLRLVSLVGQRGRVTLKEVAEELGVGDSTAHRLLSTCRHVGFVRQDQPGAAYEAGPALHELALGATRAVSLRDAAGPLLSEAAKELNETVSLVILEGARSRFVESIEGRQSVRVASPLGQVFPAHATAGGKAILAHLSAFELDRRYPTKRLPPVTSHSVTEWQDLLADLDRIERRGWAVEFGETDLALAGVGVPIIDSTGTPRAAICVSVPLIRLSNAKEAAAFAETLDGHAEQIQRRLRGSN